MTDEVVIFDDVNLYTGMRGVLVKRPHQAVEVEPWLERVPLAARRSLMVERFELEDGKFTWHHLKLDWCARELIGFERDDSRLAGLGLSFRVKVNAGEAIPAAAWTIEAGRRMSDGMLAAVTLYAEQVKFHPQVILVQHLPERAPKQFTIGDFRFPILAAEWVWSKMVLVL